MGWEAGLAFTHRGFPQAEQTAPPSGPRTLGVTGALRRGKLGARAEVLQLQNLLIAPDK